MGRHLLQAFAADNPDRFAQMLGVSGNLTETMAILAEIPASLKAEIVARLTPAAADRLLFELPDTEITGWLIAGSGDAGRRLLSRISPDRAIRLLSSINDRSKRQSLQRMIHYEPGSIGEVTQMQITAVRQTSTAADLSAEFQCNGLGADAPIAIVRRDGTVKGVLDLTKFVQNKNPSATATDFCIRLDPVFADAPLSSLKSRSEWAILTSLPVVDHKRQLLGYVTNSALGKSAATSSTSNAWLDAAGELSRRLLEFMSYSLALLFGRHTRL